VTGVDGQTVVTSQGKVRGAADGNAMCFRGIPYAASPIGELRFALPEPHPGWAGVREAVKAGPSVPQGPSRLEQVMGHCVPDWNEDGCLTLNVFCPSRAGERQELRPVLVWFHGGGFTSGSGGWDWYDGAHLAALGDMLVVTANYRVGPLGYLYLPEIGADILGVQDQGAVLRWVHDNIATFGGDPLTVIVGGQSAGAYSALFLALDEQTTEFVTRVLLESGPFGLAPQDPQNADENTEAYLRLLACPATRTRERHCGRCPLGNCYPRTASSRHKSSGRGTSRRRCIPCLAALVLHVPGSKHLPRAPWTASLFSLAPPMTRRRPSRS
jgi:para-nitrobenzyl esterase